MNEKKIQMVFFDAAGTLFDVRGSVGEIYARIAATYDKHVSAAELQHEFARRFPLQPPMAFARTLERTERLRLEQNWWRNLVQAVFARFGEFPQFEDYFVEIFEFFRQADAWEVFADVAPTLTALKTRGIRLGVISNFDARLYDLLDALQLRPYFDSIHISTEVGAAKPDAAIFRAALADNELQPAQALHVGDSLTTDVHGAEAVRMEALWLVRDSSLFPPEASSQLTALSANSLVNLFANRIDR
jgi:putative hydrolase of the HAD superfamily